jgi:dihydroneopterin aldolase
MFTVKINKLKVRAKIGVFVVERSTAQPLLVTLKFSYRINNNKDVNNINNLKSYSEIINFSNVLYREDSMYFFRKFIISE